MKSPTLLFSFCKSLRIGIGLLFCIPLAVSAQSPAPVLVGYFQNWHTASTPYIQLDHVDARYNIVNAAFAVPKAGTDYNMQFIPEMVSQPVFIAKISALQLQGRKVFISLGGGNSPVKLDNEQERDVFVSSIGSILNTFGFDGIDIDFEGSSLAVSGGTIAAPVDQPVIYLIDAIRQIMDNYRASHNRKLLLSMAPETAFVQGGQSAYGGVWGAYLPLIHALRDSLDLIHVQLYNSGSMYGIDGKIYSQGTADFIVAMCEALISGFHTAGGFFEGLPPEKVGVGLPACPSAAGGGFTNTAVVKTAVEYLLGKGPRPGTYTMANPAGYPNLRGMMTWSINWDASPNCGNSYEFAQNYEDIFLGGNSGFDEALFPGELRIFPNPARDKLHIRLDGPTAFPVPVLIFNTIGHVVMAQQLANPDETLDVSELPKGMYGLWLGNYRKKVIIW